MRAVPLPLEDEALSTNQILARSHYLGATTRGFTYRDEFGVMVLSNPTSRRLPQSTWLELIRWCLVGVPNGGSQQWRRAARWLRETRPTITTVVSYSDPSAGHTGALYRACNWHWAPTWHRLREPPTGNGAWLSGCRQAVKDRWVFELTDDADRAKMLGINDAGVRRQYPYAEYIEGRGGDYRRWMATAKAAS